MEYEYQDGGGKYMDAIKNGRRREGGRGRRNMGGECGTKVDTGEMQLHE